MLAVGVSGARMRTSRGVTQSRSREALGRRSRKAVLGLLATAMLALVGPGAPAQSASSVVYGIDFAGFAGGSALEWLEARGFLPRQDASNASRIVYSIARDTLNLEAKTRAFGLLLNETDVRNYSKIRIEWGVDAFPQGASYENGVRSEAVMVYVFFGKERHASGSLFIPDSPYFIGLFLCESGATNQPFIGRYHQASGRFVCVDRPSAGAPVTTEYPIADAFTRIFGQHQAPDISGFAISIDTASAPGTGVAKSFIKKIEFLK